MWKEGKGCKGLTNTGRGRQRSLYGKKGRVGGCSRVRLILEGGSQRSDRWKGEKLRSMQTLYGKKGRGGVLKGLTNTGGGDRGQTDGRGRSCGVHERNLLMRASTVERQQRNGELRGPVFSKHKEKRRGAKEVCREDLTASLINNNSRQLGQGMQWRRSIADS